MDASAFAVVAVGKAVAAGDFVAFVVVLAAVVAVAVERVVLQIQFERSVVQCSHAVDFVQLALGLINRVSLFLFFNF